MGNNKFFFMNKDFFVVSTTNKLIQLQRKNFPVAYLNFFCKPLFKAIGTEDERNWYSLIRNFVIATLSIPLMKFPFHQITGERVTCFLVKYLYIFKLFLLM